MTIPVFTYFRLLQRYLQYFWNAKTKYDVHSPFVAELMAAVVDDDRNFYAFSAIEYLRQNLLYDTNLLNIKDFGAGSKVNANSRRTVGNITRYSAVPPAVGQLLFRLVHFSKPKKILELGSALGISTLYMSAAAIGAQVITVEGSQEIADKAKENFRKLNTSNVESLCGQFETLLPLALEKLARLDFLFLDGDHRPKASLKYFDQCLPYAHHHSVFVIADIHWSAEMEQAWAILRQHPRVRLSVDLFYVGLLFFREENKEKEHFTLIKSRLKPWRIGLF